MLTYTEAKECIKELGKVGAGDIIERMGADVVKAGLSLGISPNDIEEAYSGEFDSPEDFAQNMAEEIGSIDKNATWPNNCIDWEYAARELMYDYSEADGYYFRNL